MTVTDDILGTLSGSIGDAERALVDLGYRLVVPCFSSTGRTRESLRKANFRRKKHGTGVRRANEGFYLAPCFRLRRPFLPETIEIFAADGETTAVSW